MCGIQTKKRRKIFAENYKSSRGTMGNTASQYEKKKDSKMLFLPKLIAKCNATPLKVSRLSRTILMPLNRASYIWTLVRTHREFSWTTPAVSLLRLTKLQFVKTTYTLPQLPR